MWVHFLVVELNWPAIDRQQLPSSSLIAANTLANVKVRGSKVLRDGVEYVRFDRLQVRIKIGSQKISLDNLFNGDPVLGKVGNEIINQNSDLFLGEIVPGLEKSLAKTFLDIANEVLHNATYDEMFPDK